MRSKTSLPALSPPPYSSLDHFEESDSPSSSPYRASGEAVPGTSTRAAEHADSNHKGKERRRDEEEVEDRAELPRMIGMCHKPLNCLLYDLRIRLIVKPT
jgi:hypothetical protein